MAKKILCIIICLLVLASCKTKKRGGLEVHFLDVGQADATLILTEKNTVMIDCGNASDYEYLSDYLKKQSVKNIDVLILTHPHEDHIGGIFALLEKIHVNKIIMYDISDDNEYYKNINDVIKTHGVLVEPLKDGMKMALGDIKFEIAVPFGYNSENVFNNASGVVRMEYKSISVLFASDIEKIGEARLLDSDFTLESDMIKAPHHGSDTSSGYDFLKEVSPDYVVVSCGLNNRYGHPSETVLTRYAAMGCELYRTDIDGNVVMKSDGDSITFKTDRNNEKIMLENVPGEYVGSTVSRKFHHINCDYLPGLEISVLFKNTQEALENGYSSCGLCIE